MQAWEIARFGFEGLRRVERAPLSPGPGQVKVALRAASLNYRDVLMARGHYNPRQALPLVPCSDGAGVVAAVGEGVERWQVGDRVCPIFAQSWIDGPPDKAAQRSTLGGPLDGCLASEIVVEEAGLVAIPPHLSFQEAACLPCAGVTAWSALEGVEAGDTVLVQGTGGVSLFALQLAKARGARVFLTSSSDAKLERGRALGADETLNYRDEPRWGSVAADWAGEGVDCVVEVGGAGTLDQSLRAVRMGGTVALIGVLSGVETSLAVTRILMAGIRVQGVFVGSRAAFEALNQAVAAASLRPVIDRVVSFDEAADTLRAMPEGRHVGKLVVRT